MKRLVNYLFFRYIYYFLPIRLTASIKFKILIDKNGIDWAKPMTYNEKINYRKIYQDNYWFSILSNKYLVRKYVNAVIGKEYLIPLIKCTSFIDMSIVNSLPNEVVIKTSHGSGSDYVQIIEDISKENKKRLIRKFKKSLKLNYGRISGEKWYSNTPKYLLFEKKLNLNSNFTEAKIYCFNNSHKGKRVFDAVIRVVHDRFGEKKSSFYDLNWEYLDLYYQNDKKHEPIKKTEIYETCIQLSKKLSVPFDHVRIDFIIANDKIYFGEMTFADCSGFISFSEKKWDKYFGEKWEISND